MTCCVAARDMSISPIADAIADVLGENRTYSPRGIGEYLTILLFCGKLVYARKRVGSIWVDIVLCRREFGMAHNFLDY